jgi:hypothetical protein
MASKAQPPAQAAHARCSRGPNSQSHPSGRRRTGAEMVFADLI